MAKVRGQDLGCQREGSGSGVSKRGVRICSVPAGVKFSIGVRVQFRCGVGIWHVTGVVYRQESSSRSFLARLPPMSQDRTCVAPPLDQAKVARDEKVLEDRLNERMWHT